MKREAATSADKGLSCCDVNDIFFLNYIHRTDILLHTSCCGLVLYDTLWCDRRVSMFWWKTLPPTSWWDSDSFYWPKSSHLYWTLTTLFHAHSWRHTFISRLGVHLWLCLFMYSNSYFETSFSPCQCYMSRQYHTSSPSHMMRTIN
jgi:hypothetical protein